MTQDQKFEIPQELRQLAEENVERARKSTFSSWMSSGKPWEPERRWMTTRDQTSRRPAPHLGAGAA